MLCGFVNEQLDEALYCILEGQQMDNNVGKRGQRLPVGEQVCEHREKACDQTRCI